MVAGAFLHTLSGVEGRRFTSTSAILLLALAACDKSSRPDPIVAEVKSPVRAVMRAHEVDVPATCEETGFRRLKCLFKSEHHGCLYLEVGASVETPIPSPPATATPAPDFCERSDVWSPTRFLVRLGPDEAVELREDDTGERLALRVGSGAWEILYLLDGEIISRLDAPRRATALKLLSHHAPLKLPTPPAPQAGSIGFEDEDEGEAPDGGTRPPFDWKDVDTLDDNIEKLITDGTYDVRGRLYARVLKREGPDRLVELLSRGTMDVAWEDARDDLDARAKRKLTAALAKRLDAEGANDYALVQYFVDHPEERPKNFGDVLYTHLAEADPAYFDDPTSFQALLELGDARAGELACTLVGNNSVNTLMNGYDEFGNYGSTENGELFAAIALHKTKCPWVSVELEKSACDVDLRCDAKGQIEGYSDEPEDDHPFAAPVQNQLCSPAAAANWAKNWKGTPPRDEDDIQGDPPPRGTLLLAAAYAQGPLPKDVLSRDARRLYRIEHVPPLPDKKKMSEDAYTEALDMRSCANLANDPQYIACKLPLHINVATVSGCRIRIDDAKKTMVLEELHPFEPSPGEVDPPENERWKP